MNRGEHMSNGSSHDDARLSLGAYVLGTLEPGDQHLVEAHLAGCPACLSELTELEPVVPLLATLTGDDIAPEPSPDLFARIATAVDDADAAGAQPDRVAPIGGRSRRWLVAVAAGVVLLAGAGTAVGFALATSSHPVTSASATANGIHLQVTATDAESGTRLVLTAKGLPARERCHLVAVAADGSRHDAGTWSASYVGQARVVEGTDVARSDLRRLTLYGNGHRRLVTIRF